MPTIEECWNEVLDAAKRWRETVYVDREPAVWPEERKLAEAVDQLLEKE